MNEPTARAIGTAAIWISVAIILAFGICRMNWGDAFPFILVIALICAAAAAATSFVWGLRPPKAQGPS